MRFERRLHILEYMGLPMDVGSGTFVCLMPASSSRCFVPRSIKNEGVLTHKPGNAAFTDFINRN